MEEMVQQQQQQQEPYIPFSTTTSSDNDNNHTDDLSTTIQHCCRLCSHMEADVVVDPCGCHIHAVRAVFFICTLFLYALIAAAA